VSRKNGHSIQKWRSQCADTAWDWERNDRTDESWSVLEKAGRDGDDVTFCGRVFHALSVLRLLL